MRITCLNAWGGRLHGALAEWLASHAPDILCLQEVVHTRGATHGWLRYRDDGMDLPQRADMLADLRAALPRHHAYFCPAVRGDLWEGETPRPSLWGIATHVRGDLPVLAQAQGFVHGDYCRGGFGPHPRARNAHVIRVPLEGGFLTLAHTHGLRDLAGKGDSPARDAQTERLLALVAQVARPGDALAICGDFNMLPDSRLFDAMAARGLAELVTARGHEGTRTSHYAKPGRFADYCFVSPELAGCHFEVIRDPEVSDHCPLVLEIG